MSPQAVSLLAARIDAQGLATRPARDPLAVAERLLAVQGKDPRGPRLAVRARSEGLRAADVDRALTEDRSLIVTWVNRGTLHLVRSEDCPLLQALTTPPLETSCWTRLRQTGVSPSQAEKGVAAIDRALAEEGPLTRAQVRELLDRARVPTAGQALIHVIFLAALRGVCVRGPMVGKEQAFVRTENWLGPQPEIDRDAARAELARRYLVGHGPADDRDLARWAGINLTDARAGLAAIASGLAEHDDGLVDLKRRGEVAPLPPPRLLGAFDPLLLGWTSREEVVGPHKLLVTVNGIFRPFALVEGKAVATWKSIAAGLGSSISARSPRRSPASSRPTARRSPPTSSSECLSRWGAAAASGRRWCSARGPGRRALRPPAPRRGSAIPAGRRTSPAR